MKEEAKAAGVVVGGLVGRPQSLKSTGGTVRPRGEAGLVVPIGAESHPTAKAVGLQEGLGERKSSLLPLLQEGVQED